MLELEDDERNELENMITDMNNINECLCRNKLCRTPVSLAMCRLGQVISP